MCNSWEEEEEKCGFEIRLHTFNGLLRRDGEGTRGEADQGEKTEMAGVDTDGLHLWLDGQRG